MTEDKTIPVIYTPYKNENPNQDAMDHLIKWAETHGFYIARFKWDTTTNKQTGEEFLMTGVEGYFND